MHRQDAIYLDQLCPKISNKTWKDSLHKLTNINAFTAVIHQNHLIIFIQCQKEVEALQVIACHVVCHVMEKNQIQKFLVGTENKIFMILEGLWPSAHGLMTN